MEDFDFDNVEETGDSDKRYMVVVGRAKSIAEFVETVSESLFDNFSLKIADPIEDEVGIDGKIRLLGVIEGVEMSQYTFKTVAMRLSSSQYHGSMPFKSPEEAFEFASSEYGFGEEEPDKAEKLQRVAERFPEFTVTEVEQVEVFNSFMQTHRIHSVRALFDDEPVILLVKITATNTDMNITPLAVLVNEVVAEHLEYSWEEEEE